MNLDPSQYKMSPELKAALEKAKEWMRTATPEEKAEMHRAQRESWVRAEKDWDEHATVCLLDKLGEGSYSSTIKEEKIPKIRLIRQEDRTGCEIAVAAMLLDLTYEDAITLFEHQEGEFHNPLILENLLVKAGFAISKLYQIMQPGNRRRAEWPPQPWADIHWCDVIVHETSKAAHAVVMLGNGDVLDPASEQPKRLSDYHSVNFVAAVFDTGRKPHE